MATTEKTRDDVVEQNDPNTFVGLALGFAGLCLIAKEKLLLGTLSLVGGALIGLQSHQDQQKKGAASPKKGSKPKQLTAKPAAEKRAKAKAGTTKPAGATAKPTPSKATSTKADTKKASASETSASNATASQTASTKTAPAKSKATTSKATTSKAAQSKATKPEAAKSKGTQPKAAKPKAAKSTSKKGLNQIEGIGPKIAEVLSAAGLQTFDQIAQATPEQIRGILAEAGNRYRLADPTTWPEQAALASEGKWDDLKTLQGQLKGGRRSA